VIGVQNVHLMLYQLFVEANQPLPAMGVKQWSAKLTSRQRQVCASLPAPTATEDGVLTAMRAAGATGSTNSGGSVIPGVPGVVPRIHADRPARFSPCRSVSRGCRLAGSGDRSAGSARPPAAWPSGCISGGCAVSLPASRCPVMSG
jgi:hypothetical protein